MMCEHENFFTAVNAPNNPEVQVACHDCKQFIGHPDDVIFGLKQEIAAANARIAELEATLNETYTDDFGTVWTRPTAWAYATVCKANDKNREAKEQAEAQCAYWENKCKELENGR